MNEELKPCPFCGGDWQHIDDRKLEGDGGEYSHMAFVVCYCGCDGPEAYGATAKVAKDAALRAWNTRPAPAVQVPEVKRYTVTGDYAYPVVESADGEFVQYDDYAAMLAAAPTPATVATEAVAQTAKPMTWDDQMEALGELAEAHPVGGCALPRREPVAQDDPWPAIMADDELKRARSVLSIHEIRLLLKHAKAAYSGAVAQGGGVDVEKVMALVEEYAALVRRELAATIGSVRRFREGEADEKRAEIRTLLASAPAGTVGDGWMPIETAPKDGTPVLLLYKGYIVEAVWECVDSGDWEHGYGPSYWWDSDLVMMDDGTEPTHWMLRSAIPPALAATKKEEGHE